MTNQQLLEEYRRTKSVAVRNRIVTQNMKMVYSIVSRIHDLSPQDREDAIQEGAIALAEVVDKHDPSRGQFSTVAWMRIKQRVNRYLNTTARTFPRTSTTIRNFILTNKTVKELITKGIEPTNARIEKALKEQPKGILMSRHKMALMAERVASIHQPLNRDYSNGEEVLTLEGTIPDKNNPDIYELIDLADRRIAVYRAHKKLSPIYREAIDRMYYHNNGELYKDIASDLGISVHAFKRRRDTAVQRLKEMLC